MHAVPYPLAANDTRRQDRTPQIAIAVLLSVVGLLTAHLEIDWLGFSLAVGTFLALLCTVNPWVSVHILFLVGFSNFIFFPAIISTLAVGTGYELFFLSVMPALSFLYVTRKIEARPNPPRIQRAPILFVALLGGIALLMVAGWGAETHFIPLAIVLFAMAIQSRSRLFSTLMLALLLGLVLLYSQISWTGFGRIGLAGWALTAIVYYLYSQGIRPSRMFFSIAPTLFSVSMIDRELGGFELPSVRSLLQDSAFGPYIGASTFVDEAVSRGLEIGGLIDQLLFSVFVFVPREWWPGKPFGFGFQYTVDNLEKYLVSAGHSIAGTLIGEHLYYIGYFGVATGVITFILVGYGFRAMASLKIYHRNGLAAVASTALILPWGGLSSFATYSVFAVSICLAAIPIIWMLLPAEAGCNFL